MNFPENPSRRTFVKAAVLTGTTCLLPDPTPLFPFHHNQKPVIILGAGAAGLAAAYELKKKGIPFEIYEASSRYGGRIQTKKNFNKENMFCELGAELIDTNHEYLFSLAKELSIEMERFNKEGLVNQAFYFQGQFLTENDIANEFIKLVRHIQNDLHRIFAGQQDKTVNYRMHSKIAEYFDHMDLETYLQSLQNIDPYILELVRVAYVCEFGLETHQQSALNLLLLMDPEINVTGELYGSSDEGWRVKGGNSNLMDALATNIRTTNEIYFHHKLVGIKERNNKIILTFDDRGIYREVMSEHVICTIPFSVLRQIDGVAQLDLSERKHLAIQNFTMGSNAKLILGFQDRFWSNSTQHPKNFFHGQLCTQFDSQFFWDSSRQQIGKSGILTNYLGGTCASTADASNLEKALNDFSTLYPETQSCIDGHRAIANWSQNPYAFGSYVCPTPGTYTTYLGSLAQPELRNKLHFAGEHTSETSLGYINGALESGQQAALAVTYILRNSF